MTLSALTRPQADALDALARFVSLHGYAPSRAELARMLSLSVSALEERLDGLERKGRIRRIRGLARAITIT